MITKRVKIINGMIISPIFPKYSSIPSVTKNNVAKKSFKEFTLLIISKLYGSVAKLIPAINAPMTIENPKSLKTIA